jgi:DNA-binding MarR family transcriptional regulator
MRDASVPARTGAVLGGDASRTAVTDGPPKIRLAAKRPRRTPKPLGNPISEFALVPSFAAYDSAISNAAFRIFVVMCHHANSSGVTYISQAGIARKLGITRTAVTNQIKTLLEHMYIHRVRAPTPGKASARHRIIYDRDQLAAFRTLVAHHTQPIEDRMRRKGNVTVDDPNIGVRIGIKKETKAKKESVSIDEKLRTMVIERYAAEGLPPPSEALIAESVADLLRQCPEIASEQPTAHDQVPGKGDIA